LSFQQLERQSPSILKHQQESKTMTDTRNNSTVIYLDHEELVSAIHLCYRAELLAVEQNSFVRCPAVIWGDPGIGKTSLVRVLAKKLAEKFGKSGIKSGFWCVSLATKEVVDLGGFPVPNKETGLMDYFPPADLPYIIGKPTEDNMPHGVINLDDVDRTQNDTKNGAMSLMLERAIHGNHISPHVYVCATANGEADAGSTSPLGDACGNRLVHLYLRPSPGWSAFLGSKMIMDVESMLNPLMRQTNYRETALCTPRSIEMAKWVIASVLDESRIVVSAVINGCVGKSAGAILTKAGLRSFTLANILNKDQFDLDLVCFDDIDMLRRELEQVPENARGTTKIAVTEWANTLEGEFSNIVKAAVIQW